MLLAPHSLNVRHTKKLHMAISDTNPERRNLILASLAFILFYAAGGSLIDDKVRVMVVNISFSKPQILVLFAWIILLWFCLRFWQKSGFKFWSSILSEIMSDKIPVSIANYAKEKAKNQLIGAHAVDHSSKEAEVAGLIYKPYSFYVLCNFKSGSNVITHQEQVKLEGIKGLVFIIRKIISHSIKNNAFSEELVPYLLFISAVSAPSWSKCI